ncbi:uncharacterized protein F5891DRAFT_1193363 [Suillus fuscotomentosus]|uniref:DUF6830 domain-containing protein n=1 Tax=Suillus fuscotomentosus TaxID=1912939 RepID=A0AAD4DZ02_9AGAM|nr:uncharacterized protein F5891DRAFT_1193363 [Suillus fuscotomentosus]KAG1896131.1 hypothetical protein F5891DRAFT_1193363 [Suillus fuscotomentosus]
MTFRRLQTMTKHPSAKAINIDKLIEDYGATYFREALARYITQLSHTNGPCLSSQTLDVLAHDVHLPFRSLPVFHKIKWLSVDTRDHGNTTVTLDSVHARPQWSSGSSPLARRSDTALRWYTRLLRWPSTSHFFITTKVTSAPFAANSPGTQTLSLHRVVYTILFSS